MAKQKLDELQIKLEVEREPRASKAKTAARGRQLSQLVEFTDKVKLHESGTTCTPAPSPKMPRTFWFLMMK